jgi:hypothetical protein
VLDQSGKQGGRLVASSSSCPFKKFIDHSGLVDLGLAGNPNDRTKFGYSQENEPLGRIALRKYRDRTTENEVL